jgi:hypothetical protein
MHDKEHGIWFHIHLLYTPHVLILPMDIKTHLSASSRHLEVLNTGGPPETFYTQLMERCVSTYSRSFVMSSLCLTYQCGNGDTWNDKC